MCLFGNHCRESIGNTEADIRQLRRIISATYVEPDLIYRKLDASDAWSNQNDNRLHRIDTDMGTVRDVIRYSKEEGFNFT